MSSPLAKQLASTSSATNYKDFKEIEKYVKHLFFKTAQIIIQSRQGGKSCTESQPHPKSQSWFNIAINDNSEISHEAKKVANATLGSTGGHHSILPVPLCIEISLKTTEGDLLVLETWVISMRDSSDATVRHNTVYNHMGLLLKSLLCVSRVLPAYRLARRQGPDTHVMCYRIFPGEPSLTSLGSGQQSSQVGQVITSVGTLNVRVDYRTEMTIAPGCLPSGSGGQTGSAGGETTTFSTSGSSSNLIAKSDYFSNENLRCVNTLENLGGDANPVTTSDESSEAMRIFYAASPPDNTFIGGHKRDHAQYSSNESLQPKFRSRSNTNQSHKSDDVSNDSNEVKVGAFVTRKGSSASDKVPTPTSGPAKGATGSGSAVPPSSAEKDEDFFELFDVETSDAPQQQQQELEAKVRRLKLEPSKFSSAQRKLSFDEQEEETQQQQQLSKDEDVLAIKAPFSAVRRDEMEAAAGVGGGGDLGAFFKDVQHAPTLKLAAAAACNEMTESTLESQLSSLNEQLYNFESNLESYDELMKNLEATATTSESESEAN